MPYLRDAALELLAEDFCSHYGSVETGWVAAGNAEELRVIENTAGRILDGIEVATFDSEGRMLPVGSEGQIRVKGQPGTTGSYIGRQDTGQSAFIGDWFAMGDIGLVDQNRNLVLRGRASNVINIGGSKTNPEAIEELLLALDKIVEVGVTGVDVPEGYEEIHAAVVGAQTVTVDEVNAYLRQRQFPWPVRRIKIVSGLPKTYNGKIDRQALKRLCADPTPRCRGFNRSDMFNSPAELFEAISANARRYPGSIALASRTGYMNYTDLVGNIASVAEAAARGGIKSGQLVVPAVGNPDMAFVIALALMRIGCRVGYATDLGLYEASGVAVDAVIADPHAAQDIGRPIVSVAPDWFKGADADLRGLPPPAEAFSVVISSSGSDRPAEAD